MISKEDSPKTNPLGFAGKIDDKTFGRVYVTFIAAGQDDFVLPSGTKWAPDAEQMTRVKTLEKFLDPIDGTLTYDAIQSLRLLNIAANVQRSIGKLSYVVVKASVVRALDKAGQRGGKGGRFNCIVTWAELASSLM